MVWMNNSKFMHPIFNPNRKKSLAEICYTLYRSHTKAVDFTDKVQYVFLIIGGKWKGGNEIKLGS